MASINSATKEIVCKIVYYGPGMSGKTTNLQFIHRGLPETNRGQLVSLDTRQERTLFFDFLPIDLGTIDGYQTKFQLYTVPGQVFYNATRKLVLRGVDGIVFVADSQLEKMAENAESLQNLHDNLREYGYSLAEMPHVFQYNKQDLPGALSLKDMDASLNPGGVAPSIGAVACQGVGVKDTLKIVASGVLDKLRHQIANLASSQQRARAEAEVAAARAAAAAQTAHPSRLSATATAAAPRLTARPQRAAPPPERPARKLIDPTLLRQHRPQLTRRPTPMPPPPPRWDVDQPSDVWWHGLRIGRGRLRVEPRQNVDGEGAHLFSARLWLWGLWRRSLSGPASADSPAESGRWARLKVSGENGDGGIEVLVGPGSTPSLWLRLGSLTILPQGERRGAWPGAKELRSPAGGSNPRDKEPGHESTGA